MAEQPYATEDVLQKLLADYPELLASDARSGEPRRWLLISRELGLAADDGGGSRWSVDHLFVDQDGVPTLVEVKRSSDTQSRPSRRGIFSARVSDHLARPLARKARRHGHARGAADPRTRCSAGDA
jgi:hypothetical protein